MTLETKTTASAANRRSSRRLTASNLARIECRKGALGLGLNLCTTILDISETGVRLVLKTELKPGQEVEVILHGGAFGRPVKRLAKIMWSLRLDNGSCCAGLHFDRAMPYSDIQRLTRSMR